MTLLLACIAWTMLPSPLVSQTAAPGEGTPLVTTRLVTEATDVSRAFVVGLSFAIAPGWYLYWKNPGDAGFPLEVQWRMPAGFRVTPLQYPTPEKIIHGDIVAYGYYDELLVACTVIPPPGYIARPEDAVRADLDWLVCKESCVPGRDSLFLTLERIHESSGTAAGDLFDRFRERMPQPLAARSTVAGPVSLRPEGGHIVATIPLSGDSATGVTDFFPEPQEAFVVDHKGITVGGGGITVRLTPYDSAARLDHLDGLVVYGRRGYTLHVDIHNQP